jgi:hypothetical protein
MKSPPDSSGCEISRVRDVSVCPPVTRITTLEGWALIEGKLSERTIARLSRYATSATVVFTTRQAHFATGPSKNATPGRIGSWPNTRRHLMHSPTRSFFDV